MAAVATFCSMAQGRSLNPEDKALWVIDGLVMDTTTVTRGEIVTDSIEPWLERYFRLLRASDEIQIYCVNPNVGIIVITTRKDSGLRDLELNGVYTTKRKRIGLAELYCKTYLNDAIEKRWKIKHIKSIQIHPEGKTVVDRKGRSHTVFISIETK